MQIHDLNTKALTDPAYVAFDDGTDTYKVEFNDTVESAAQDAVADADLTQNTVGFTSGDSLSPSGWTSVPQITTDSTLATLFNRISTMVKNVRYIWNLLGSSSFSNVASTLTGAIGNTALTTTAQTLSGAIAEHESDISTLNSKNEDAWEYIGSLSNSALNNASIQIDNYRAYSFFIVDVVMQGWGSVYVIPAKYTTNVQMQFGYNKGSSCNVNYNGTAMVFSSPSFPSGVSSIGAVRLYGIRR